MRKINWKEIEVDGLLLTNPKNIRHFTNVQLSLGYLLITKRTRTLYVDSRYFEVASKTFDGKVIQFGGKNGMKDLIDAASKLQSLGIEGDFVTLNEMTFFKKLNKNIKPINGQLLRTVKTDDEIKSLSKAVSITKKVMTWASEQLKPGITEKQISNMVIGKLLEMGSEELDYQPIIAGGPNSSLPHAKPSNRKFKQGDTVMFDFAAVIDGYTADLTRNYSVGEVKNEEINKIREIVKKSQMAGIKAIKPGVTGADIDKICRDIIVEAGYGQYFGHGTGHGLGRDVHEFPRVGPSSNTKFKAGNVVTVEPGIYLPGIGGIRIEDDILVTKTGYKIL